MAKIVVTNRIFPKVEQRLRALGEVIINHRGAPWSRDELIAQLHDADAMLAFMTDTVDTDLLRRCPRLKIVAGALKGYDNFDVEACTQAGVWLTVVSDLLTIPTAELAVALTLGLNRNLLAGDERVRSGHFDGWRAELYGFGLNGAEVGIAGLGRVGLAIAERLTGFGALLRGFDKRSISPADLANRRILQVEWDDLIGESDVIILALPLNERTFHMIDARSLSHMRRGSRLVNVGRGSVVDEEAVAQSLEERHLGGYAADVFEMEDRARDERPRAVSPRLLALRECTLFTPHLGSAVGSARLAIEQAAVDAIAAVFSGHLPANAVNSPSPVRSRLIEARAGP
jgi:phosphonate dehydrogenase